MRTANLLSMPLTGVMPAHKPTGYGIRTKSGSARGLGECADCKCNCECFCEADPDDCW